MRSGYYSCIFKNKKLSNDIKDSTNEILYYIMTLRIWGYSNFFICKFVRGKRIVSPLVKNREDY